MKNKLYIALLLFNFSNLVNAQWPTTIEENLIINNWANGPFSVVEDKNGGAFILYGIEEGTSYPDAPINNLWFMRINKFGNTVLEPIKIGNDNSWLDAKGLFWASDGNLIIGISKNTLLYWDGSRPVYYTRLLIQKIDTLGNQLWNDGVYAINDTLQNSVFDLIPDTDGGCFISTVAVNKNTLPFYTGYKTVQHIGKDGDRLWGDSGSVLYTGEFNENDWSTNYRIYRVSEEKLMVISEYRYLIGIYENVLGLNENGARNWTLPPREGYKFINGIVDRIGGMYLLYKRYSQDFTSYEFSVDRINKDGNYTFDNPGVFIDSCGTSSKIRSLSVTEDNVLNVLWLESNESNKWETYFQKVDTTGKTVFYEYGHRVIPSNYSPRSVILTEDHFIVLANTISTAIIQKYTKQGEKLWNNEGVIIADNLDLCFVFPHLITDNNEGCLVLWLDCLQGIRGKQISKNGELGIVTKIKKDDIQLPNKYYVSKNYPNPFNPKTTITYSVQNSSNLVVSIFNALGEVVKETIFSELMPGNYNLEIDGSNLSSGIYFTQFLFTDSKMKNQVNFKQINKMILLK